MKEIANRQQQQQQRIILIISQRQMDSTDIPCQVFHQIFIQPTACTPETIKHIIEWNDNLDPSFNIVKAQFRKFIAKQQGNICSLCRDVTATLSLLQQYKCPRNFMRAYLDTVKTVLEGVQSQAKQSILDKKQQYQARWKQINPQVLQSYFEAFSLKNKISQQQINAYIQEMINTKKYNNCLDFIKFLGVGQNKENIDKLMAKMSTKRDASKAADYVKRLNLDPKNYPALGERLYKNTARHFLSKHGWEYAQQIFEEYPQALACIVEDLIYKKKYAQARSIWSRHPLWQYLQKEESKAFLNNQQEGNQQIAINSIICNDSFGPTNKQKQLSLSAFVMTSQDVFWVDTNSQHLQAALDHILQAQLLGIDTQSIVGQTKFEKVNEAAVIQVSTGKKVYIFDGFKLNHPKIGQVFLQCFNTKKIIGHSFTNDTQPIFTALGLKNASQIGIKNLIDICKVYKGLHQKQKYSSLAHICKQVLGKQLCKDQTLTNWKRRPLRRNQLHYAALDAQVVIQIYRIWLKEYGQIVHYHAALDNDQI